MVYRLVKNFLRNTDPMQSITRSNLRITTKINLYYLEMILIKYDQQSQMNSNL